MIHCVLHSLDILIDTFHCSKEQTSMHYSDKMHARLPCCKNAELWQRDSLLFASCCWYCVINSTTMHHGEAIILHDTIFYTCEEAHNLLFY